jgi:excisionase family DNA binding protein
MNATANSELFVDANRVAEWLRITPRRVLEMARKGQIPAHPLGTGHRKTWRFRLSEVDAAIVSKK